MPDMTVNQVITAAYRKNGIKNPNASQLADGLLDLQNMLSSWSAEGLTVPFYSSENFTLTVGQAVYTIGTGGDFDTARPLKIVNAYIRINGYDYYVDSNMTKSEYHTVTSKTNETRPTRFYYDPQYPLGRIRFNYEPDSAYDFHMTSEKPFVSPSALTDTFSIPLEVNRAIIYNLAIELAPDYDNKLPPDVYGIAADSKMTLENYNTVDKLSDSVRLDSAIYRSGSSMDVNIGE